MRKSVSILLFLFLFLLFSACAVLEDRVNCLCTLSLDIGNAYLACPSSRLLLKLSSEKNSYREDIAMEREKEELEFEVDKGRVGISALIGLEQNELKNGCVVIKEGWGCDRIYTSLSSVMAEGERCEASLLPHKQHSVIDLQFSPETDFGAAGALKVTVESNVSGFDIENESPLPGIFRVEAAKVGERHFRVVLPRQIDNSCKMTVIQGAKATELALGEYLERSGMDWKKDNLDDAGVYIGESEAEVEVEIIEWENIDYQDVSF